MIDPKKWERLVRDYGEVVSLEVEFDQPGRFNRFVQRVNRAPIMWTVGLLIPVYIFSFSLAFMALVSDPYIESPTATFFLLLIAATAAMAYHWFFLDISDQVILDSYYSFALVCSQSSVVSVLC